jgi:hypothetical protein
MRLGRLLALALAAVAAGAAAHAAMSSAPAARPDVTRLAVSAHWISARDGDAGREITISFRLVRPGTAVFSLTQIGPVCRRVGTFRVRGHAGVNRFRFPGRIQRRLLPPGTYRIAAPSPGGRVVRAVVVVAAGPASADERRRALDADACGRASGPAAAIVRGAAGSGQQATEAQSPLRPFVIGCLLLAIAFLGIAALPGTATPGPRAAELLTTRRPAVALAGGLVLAAGIALYVAMLV